MRIFSGHRTSGSWWFRIFGYGIHFHDHRIVDPLFSERIGARKRLHIGSFCFGLLRPDRPCFGWEYASGGAVYAKPAESQSTTGQAPVSSIYRYVPLTAQRGIMTTNEARMAIGLEPLPEVAELAYAPNLSARDESNLVAPSNHRRKIIVEKDSLTG